MVDVDALNIVVVEDDPAVLDVLTRLISNYYTNNVIPLADGKSAIEYINTHDMYVVVTDINLGDISGLDILKQIKTKDSKSQVIVITGLEATSVVETALRNEADDFIRKPFSNEAFISSIGRRINKYKLLSDNEEYKTKLELLVEDKTRKLTNANKRLTSILYNTVETVSRLIECKDPYTAGHQARVTKLAIAMSKLLGYTKEETRIIHLGGLLHDVGKICVPQELLSKPSKLTTNEFSLIKDHCIEGYKIISKIPFDLPIANLILQHHEKLDGSGYPSGITREEITREAKLLSVADMFEAMASHRPYREALEVELVIKYMNSKKGIQLDGDCVEACMSIMENHNFDIDLFVDSERSETNIDVILDDSYRR